jgi:hypothetical protein
MLPPRPRFYGVGEQVVASLSGIKACFRPELDQPSATCLADHPKLAVPKFVPGLANCG